MRLRQRAARMIVLSFPPSQPITFCDDSASSLSCALRDRLIFKYLSPELEALSAVGEGCPPPASPRYTNNRAMHGHWWRPGPATAEKAVLLITKSPFLILFLLLLRLLILITNNLRCQSEEQGPNPM